MENGVRVGADGWISKNGYYILKYNAGIRPALCLKLSSNLFSYAGTVSSDGTVNEVGYDSECGWILKQSYSVITTQSKLPPHVGYSCQVYLLSGNVGYTECFNKKKSPICFAKNILDKENEIRGLWHLPNV